MEAEAAAAVVLAGVVFLVMAAMVVEMPQELVKTEPTQPVTERAAAEAEVEARAEMAQKGILDLCIGGQTKC